MKLLGFEIKKNQVKKSVVISNMPRERIRSYDAAAISRHNENHWLYADASDADFWIRQDLPTTRNRARYEIRNNSYAEGIIATLANDLVGTGPDLQLATGNPNADTELEEKFYRWSQNCDIEGRITFGEILALTGGRQQCESGEGLIVFENIETQKNWTRARAEPLLRLRVIEPDRLASPFGLMTGRINDERIRDGIEYDENGRPAFYYILNQHPGSAANFGGFGDYNKIPASQTIHLYRQNRPGQSRGMPWITPSLSLFAQLRRFTLATIQNAESVANPMGAIETDAFGAEQPPVDTMDEVEIPRNSLLTLPMGSKMNQLKPEHPATTYEMFKNEIINEIARCLCMPFNVAAANSAKYNYASGRLDWQVYYRFIRTIRNWLEAHECNRIFYAWLGEAVLIPGYFKYFNSVVELARPEWNWPGSEHVDPKKEADAQNTRRLSLTTNLKTEYAMQGKDWERELGQIKKEKDLCEELGIPWLSTKTNSKNEKGQNNETNSE